MSKTRTKKSDARQRIVETAERLFYAEGVRAVGIDRIIAEAGVAKMSLYNHFPSKDDLILAVLQYREEKFDGHVREVDGATRQGGHGPTGSVLRRPQGLVREPRLSGLHVHQRLCGIGGRQHAGSNSQPNIRSDSMQC